MALTNQVKFKQGQSTGLTQALVTANTNTVFASTDKSLMAMAGQLYYGQPTIEYKDNKIVLYGISGNTDTKLGEVDLTLDSFLEGSVFVSGQSTLAAAEAAAYTAAQTINAGITATQVQDAYKAAFGESYNGNNSAIIMVTHNENSSGDSHSVVALPLGEMIGDSQTEIDKIEEGAGLKDDGSYSATTTAKYISGATSLADADNKLNDAIQANTVTSATFNDVTGTVTTDTAGTSIDFDVDGDDIKVGDYTPVTYDASFSAGTANTVATGDTLDAAINKVENAVKGLVDEVLANEKTTTETIKAIVDAAGVKNDDGIIAYVGNTADTYISGATSLKNADDLLDAAIKSVKGNAVTAITVADGSKDILSATSASSDAGISYELAIDIPDAVEYSGIQAINIADEAGSDGKIKDVKLVIDPAEDTDEDAVKLTQSDTGVKATLTVNNDAVTETEGGVFLGNAQSGLTATLYWGTF